MICRQESAFTKIAEAGEVYFSIFEDSTEAQLVLIANKVGESSYFIVIRSNFSNCKTLI